MADETQVIEPEVTPTPENEGNSQPEQSAEVNTAFATVKKEFREKGRQEGYAKAMEEFEQKQAQPQPDAPTPTPMPAPQPPASGLTQDDIYRATHAAMQQERTTSLFHKAVATYPDFQSKLDKFNAEAKFDKELEILGDIALNSGNVETLYTVLSDPEALAKIKEMNPKRWAAELMKISQKSEPQVNIKHNAPPIEDLKTPPAVPNTGKLSCQQLRMKQKECKTFSSF